MAATDTGDRSGVGVVYWAIGILIGIAIIGAAMAMYMPKSVADPPTGPTIQSLLEMEVSEVATR